MVRRAGPIGYRLVDHDDVDDNEDVSKPDERDDDEGEAREERAFGVLGEAVGFEVFVVGQDLDGDAG